ncbi:MAG: hypothetical protein ACJARU_000774 [Congregibacter sp.]|jgi:hypothetical protein
MLIYQRFVVDAFASEGLRGSAITAFNESREVYIRVIVTHPDLPRRLAKMLTATKRGVQADFRCLGWIFSWGSSSCFRCIGIGVGS